MPAIEKSRLAPRSTPALGPRRRASLAFSLLLVSALGAAELRAQVTLPWFAGETTGEDFVFVVDRSCSLTGPSFTDVIDAAVNDALQGLPPSSSFGLIVANDQFTTVTPGLVAATPTAKADAIAALAAIPTSGGCCTDLALVAAMDLAAGGGPATTVAFITDSLPCANLPEAIALVDAATPDGVVLDYFAFTSLPANIELFLDPLVATRRSSRVANEFVRGDANDDGVVNIADVIRILRIGFGLDDSPHCAEALDVTGDGDLEPISDAVSLASALFVPFAVPVPAPFPDCGPESAPNTLDCRNSDCP